MASPIGKLIGSAPPRSGWAVFGLYLLLSIAMRAIGFGRSVIDWDESTYLLISRAMLDGKTLYLDAWDTKPPGIFLIFAGIQSLFPKSIFAIRFFAALSLSGAAFFLYRIASHFRPQGGWANFLAGAFFLSAISTQSFSFLLGKGIGLEANSEMFFLFFTCLGAWQILCFPPTISRLFLGGITLGLGLLIKFMVAFDMLALGVAYLLLSYNRNGFSKIPSTLLGGVSLVIGAVLPLGLLIGWYATFSAHYELFWEVVFEIPGRYSSGFNWARFFKFWGDFFYVISTVSLFLVAGLILLIRKQVRWQGFYPVILVLWFALTVVSASIPGKFYIHYMYQAFPPICLLVAALLASPTPTTAPLLARWSRAALIVIIVSIPLASTFKWVKSFSKPDYPALAAQHIEAQSGLQTTLYIDNYQHITYYLLDTYPLTKYYHPSLLTRTSHQQTLGITYREEVQKILDQQPKYLIYKSGHSPKDILERFKVHYVRDTILGEEIIIMRRQN